MYPRITKDTRIFLYRVLSGLYFVVGQKRFTKKVDKLKLKVVG